MSPYIENYGFFGFILFYLYVIQIIQHCFICRPLDSTVSEDASIEPRTVETLALTSMPFNHSARSHPPLG